MASDNTALILHLQRLSTEDGPGIRTTVFFKGCPLHCSWCHNPESISTQPQIQWVETRCIGCGTCLITCPNSALTKAEDGSILIDREICQGCGNCAAACPANAMELLGTAVTLDDLISELLKDRAYYGSDGGVTASGGEPTLQSGFLLNLFTRLQEEGIHTALDTCGVCKLETLETLLPVTNLVLYDLKLFDDQDHLEWAGQHNQRILKNLRALTRLLREHYPKVGLWIRTPLIPGVTTPETNLAQIGALLNEMDGAVSRWELCAFNNLCRDKYRRLGEDWYFNETPLMTQIELDRCLQRAASSGFDPSRIAVTGAAKPET